jgi:hypothetical protein
MMPDLTYVPTADLLAELKSRYPLGMLFAGVYETPNAAEDDLETFQIDYANGLTTAIGLAVRARAWLLGVTFQPSEAEEPE